MQTCPTIKVKSDGEQGFTIINESDFDKEVHEPFDAAPVDANGDGVTAAAELRFALDAKGIPHKKKDNKAALQALLDAAK